MRFMSHSIDKVEEQVHIRSTLTKKSSNKHLSILISYVCVLHVESTLVEEY